MVGSEFIEPRTSVESSLAGIWSDLLDIEKVGIDDDFFDLGGHSIMALRLSDKIAGEFEVVISLIDLFSTTTISSQAKLLEDRLGLSASTGEASDEVATPSKSKNGEPSVFLIPGLGGYGVVFSDLIAHLEDGLNVHAVTAPGLDGQSEAISSMAELARHYIRAIKRIQPEGPYSIVGFSFGGQVAYEVAQQMQADGCELPYLAALDSMPPLSMQHLGRFRKFMRVARYHTLNVPARVRRHIRSRFRSLGNSSNGTGNKSTIATEDFLNTDLQEKRSRDNMSDRLGKTISAHQNAVRSYQPTVYSGRMVLIRSSIQRKRLHKSRWYSLHQWTDFVQDLHVVELEGTHNDIIKDPKAAALADVITEGVTA